MISIIYSGYALKEPIKVRGKVKAVTVLSR